MHQRRTSDISQMAKSALLIAMLCGASWFAIPVPFSPVVISLHTIVVNLIGLLLSPRQAFTTVFIYLLMGMVGLPVFSGGASAAVRLFSPVGGYYIGFLLSAWLISLTKGTKICFSRYVVVLLVCGVLTQHLCAVVYAVGCFGLSVTEAFLSISIPFLPMDIVKCIVSSAAAVAVKKAEKNRE